MDREARENEEGRVEQEENGSNGDCGDGGSETSPIESPLLLEDRIVECDS